MGMTPAIDITAEQRRTILALLNRYLPDTTAWAYGSRVKWTSRPESDLDLVVFARPEQSARVAELREAFEESDLPFRVDLFVWDEAPESFRKHIEAEHVVLIEGQVEIGHIRKHGWQEHEVSDLIKSGSLEIGDGYRAKNTELAASGVLFARAGNIKDGFQFDDADYFPEKNINQVENKISRLGDVVFTSKGTVGRFAFVQENTPRFVYSPQLCFWRSLNPELIDFRFLFYWISGPEFFDQFKEISGQTDMAEYVSLRDQRRMHITLPPIQQQRTIAHILGTLDDKIELNRRMNETLEAMAQSLFKSWFVDFDPVRAKMEGRDIGLPKLLTNLFPDRFVDSECGEIPEGWKAGRLADVAIAPRRNVDPVNLDDETPYIGLEHMPRRSIALAAWGRVGKVTSNKSAFNKGEVLFGKLRPYFHKVGVAPINGVCSTDIVVIASKVVEWSAFLLACVSSVEFVSYTNQGSTGTKMPRTNWTTMGDYRICLPTARVAGAFQHAMQPVLGQIAANVHESRTLAALRDTLLPNLISGEIRLCDAARQVESVA